MEIFNTYFADHENNRIASLPGIQPISKDMIIEIRNDLYKVHEVKLILDNNTSTPKELGMHVMCLLM